MAGLTKDELKSALVTHGVELNFSSAKKDELLELYDEYVAPNDLKAGEFSSDDEDLPLKSLKKKTSKSSKAASEKSAKVSKELTEENSFIVGDIQIKDLNDEELIQYLTKYGIDVGPIVDSTRSLYQKKLAIVMREQDVVDGDGEELNGHTNGTNGKLDKSLEEFSADDEVPEQEEEQVVVKKSSRKSATPKVASESKSPLQALGNSLRQRFDKNREKPERFTPTPRRSIHTYKVTETTTQTMTKGKDGVVSIDKVSTKETSESTNQTGGNKVALVMRKVLPGILMVLILLALAYYITSKKRS